VAVDYSNVPAFLTTLKSWQSERGQPELVLNLDEALSAQLFALNSPNASSRQDLLIGGFVSLDAEVSVTGTDTADAKKKKPTWYKCDVEPCVGTSLFLEVPLEEPHEKPANSLNETSKKQ